jgi:hypothetical protein
MSKSQTDYIGPDGIFLIYVRTPGLGNYNLTWEKPTTINFGVDVGVLNNKLQGSFDWYRRNTIDMIGPSEPVAKVLGVSVPVSNNTEMKGTGWELSLNYKGVINDFNYGANVNVSHHREVVTKYYNPEGLFNSFYEGKEIGEIWGFETVGIINDEETLNNMADQSLFSKTWGLGDIQYKDQLTVDTDNDGIPDAGDGKITRGSQTLEDPGDYVRIGNETPDFYYNFTLSCEYKRFDLRLFFNGIGHADWWPGEGQGERSLDTDNVFFGSSNNYYNHATLVDHLDYWTPENQDAYYPRALVGNRNVSARNKQVQTRYLQNRAYIRLKNIQMGYTLPKNLTESYLIQSARIYISGENLFTYTKLKIFDPETPGLIYPLQKIFAAGIKVTF